MILELINITRDDFLNKEKYESKSTNETIFSLT